jgi:hypothetical protein
MLRIVKIFAGWWFEHEFYFSIFWEIHNPTDEIIFLRGIGIPPTSHYIPW